MYLNVCPFWIDTDGCETWSELKVPITPKPFLPELLEKL